MKSFFTGICLFLICLQALPQDASPFRDITVQEALQLSAQQNKPVFFMGFASWCQHCEKMMTEVLPDTAVVNYFSKNFICLKMDLEKGDGPKYGKKFQVTSYPVFVIMDSTGEVLYQFVGEYKPATLIEQAKNSFTKEKQFPYLRAQFQNNPGDSTACYVYLQALSRAKINAQSVVNTYFSMHKNDWEYSPINWKILNISVNDMESEVFQFMVAHQKEFAAVVSQPKVDRKLTFTAIYNLQIPANVNDTVKYQRIRAISSELHLYKVDSAIFSSDLTLYERNKQWNRYMQTALSGAGQYCWNDYSQLRHIGEIFYQNNSDKNDLLKAAAFVKHSAEIHPEYGNTVLAAKLYLKAGDKTNAKDLATQAKEIAGSMQMNTQEADSILGQLR